MFGSGYLDDFVPYFIDGLIGTSDNDIFLVKFHTRSPLRKQVVLSFAWHKVHRHLMQSYVHGSSPFSSGISEELPQYKHAVCR